MDHHTHIFFEIYDGSERNIHMPLHNTNSPATKYVSYRTASGKKVRTRLKDRQERNGAERVSGE